MRLRALAVILAVVLAGCGGNDEPPDADGDGLTDAQERSGWVVTVDLLDRRARYNVTSDLLLQDTDGDGVLDVHEALLGSDPRKKDTDEDGLTDCEEAQHSVRAECEDPDWEGTTDRGLGTSATNADSDPGRGRYKNEVLDYRDPTGTVLRPVSWGDGIPDGAEVHGVTIALPSGRNRTVTLDPLRIDTDGDLLEDGEEVYVYGTDPTARDTDGDGCIDGLDPLPAVQELYGVRLADLRYNGSQGRDIDARITVFAADAVRTVPSEGNLALRSGVAVDPADLAAARPGSCLASPQDPWVPMGLHAWIHEGEAAVQGLDLVSTTGGAWRWNVRDALFRFGEEGPTAAAEEGITLSGADGSIHLAATVVPQGT